jgi:hypothetical protein
MDANNPEIKERIKTAAMNADKLIVRLDTLTSRIGTAKANDNKELVEYYERQFAEASVEFMDGVETILDEWYSLRGEKRPPAERERISSGMLDHIHDTVVAIVQGLDIPTMPAETTEAMYLESSVPSADAGPRHKLDVTG